MFAFLLPQEGALFVAGQWAGGWGVELGRAGLGLPGEPGSGSEWGKPQLPWPAVLCPVGSPALLSTLRPYCRKLVSADYQERIGFYPDLGYCLSIWQSVSCDTGPLGTRRQKRPVWALFCPRARWPVSLSHYGLLCPQTPAVHSRSGSCLGYDGEAPF